MIETWKPVLGWESYLEVSEDGRVRYLARNRVCRRNGSKFLMPLAAKEASQYVGKNGYAQIAIMVESKRTKLFVHRLVAAAFVPGYSEELCVNHINGVKTDNRAENLEWIPKSVNTQHQWANGLANLRGEAQPTSKLNAKQVRIIRSLLSRGIPANQIAILADVSASTIYLIRDGKRWNSLPVGMPAGQR